MGIMITSAILVPGSWINRCNSRHIIPGAPFTNMDKVHVAWCGPLDRPLFNQQVPWSLANQLRPMGQKMGSAIRSHRADSLLHTVECRYNAVQFITLLTTALRRQQQNLNQTSNSQQTPHTSPSWASYGASIVRILKKIDRVIMAPHCIKFSGTVLACR